MRVHRAMPVCSREAKRRQGSAAVPVQIFYQPNFWLSLELRLDDGVDAPPDPAEDPLTLTRIRAICARAESTDLK